MNFLTIVVILIAIYYGGKIYQDYQERKPESPKEMWKKAEVSMAKVMEKSPNIEKYLQDDRDRVQAMEKDMIRLRERFKQDSKKQSEISRDWMDFANAMDEMKSAKEMLDVAVNEKEDEVIRENIEKSFVIAEEIYERVKRILGKESASKIVNDRLAKRQSSEF